MAQDRSSNNPEDAFSFDDLIELPEVQLQQVKEKYETARWSRVLSLQQPFMDPEFTVNLADDVIAYRKHLAGTDYFNITAWTPIFDPNKYYEQLDDKTLARHVLGLEER